MGQEFYEVLFRKSLKDIENLKNDVKMYQELYQDLLKKYDELEQKYLKASGKL